MHASDFGRMIGAILLIILGWGYVTPWLFNSGWGVLNLLSYVTIFGTPYLVYLTLKQTITKVINASTTKGN